MRTSILTAVLLLAVLETASAQRLTARTYVEKTNVNLKNGAGIGMLLANDAEFGGFYQESAGFGNSPEVQPSRLLEQEFYGIYGAYPLMNRRVIDVKYQVRTGVSNGQNFVITSSILADLTLANRIKLGAGIGTRGFRPTLQSSLTIVL